MKKNKPPPKKNQKKSTFKNPPVKLDFFLCFIGCFKEFFLDPGTVFIFIIVTKL